MNRLFVTFLWLVFAPGVYAQHAYPFGQSDWRLEGDASLVSIPAGDDVLRVSSGMAYLDSANFRDGTIEFEISVTGDRAFVYLMFRGQNEEEYEDLYFRPHKSGLPDSIQYAPVFQRRSAWQLYHGDGGTASGQFPVGEWVKVRLEVTGNSALAWVGEGDEPNLEIESLGHDAANGWLAVRGFVPGNSTAEYAAKFRRFRITETDPIEVVSENSVVADGQLTSWRVSPAFDAPAGPQVGIPEAIRNAAWSTPQMQSNGVFEFLRSRPIPDGSRHWAVAADLTLHSDKATSCALHLGYSDEITLLLNDKPIAYQDSSYRFTTPRQDGVMHEDQLTVFLHLKPGENQLRAIVADRFGGWGLSAKLDSCSGVSPH